MGELDNMLYDRLRLYNKCPPSFVCYTMESLSKRDWLVNLLFILPKTQKES